MIKTTLCLLLLVTLASSMENVVELNDDTFNSEVQAEPKLWLVMFSASWVSFLQISADTAPISSRKYKK